MCEPVTIGMAVSGGIALAGGIYGAYTAKKEADYKSAVERMNARNAGYSAAFSEQKGEVNAGIANMQGSKMIGSQKARLAAAGVDPTSALDILTDTRLMSTVDAGQIRSNAAKEAYMHRISRSGFEARSKLYEDAGTDAAIGSLLGGVGRAAAYGFKTYGAGQDAGLWGA
jgi:hypothetical protein